MESDEDYEFTLETSAGSKRVVVSKSALRLLGGRSHGMPLDALAAYEGELTNLVERKLASASVVRDPIRLHGTDLNGITVRDA